MLASPQRLFRMATGTSDPVVKPRPKTIARGVKPGRIRAVLATLCSEIARNVIPVGATLPPEPELETRFGVGRGAVREAIKTLAAKGLVSVAPGHGTCVLPRHDSGECRNRLGLRLRTLI